MNVSTVCTIYIALRLITILPWLERWVLILDAKRTCIVILSKPSDPLRTLESFARSTCDQGGSRKCTSLAPLARLRCRAAQMYYSAVRTGLSEHPGTAAPLSVQCTQAHLHERRTEKGGPKPRPRRRITTNDPRFRTLPPWAIYSLSWVHNFLRRIVLSLLLP